MNKVVIIGLDGASWNILAPLIDAGELPVLADLKARGAWAKLASTVPPLTPPGWTTGVTGKNPGKHNIFDFFRYDARDYDIHLTNRQDRKSRAVWNWVSESGGKVLVMNVPHTWPPEQVNGYYISGFGTPEWDCRYTWPTELQGRLRKQYPDFSIDIPSRYLHSGNFDTFYHKINAHSTEHWKIFGDLYKELQPDFAMYAFVEMDRLFHFFYKQHEEGTGVYAGAFRDHLRHIDGLIGKFLSTLPPTTSVVLFSDHGFTRVTHDIYINNWLRDNGYLVTREAAALVTAPPMRVRIKKMIVELLSAAGVWKYYLKRRLKVLEKRGERLAGGGAEVDVKSTWYMRTVDWSQTRAAFHSMASRGIRLNVKGRDAVGCVEPQEALALAEEIKAKLLTLVDPDSGAALIKNAWTCDELFSGPYVASAADIYLEPAEGYSMHHGFAQSLVMPSTQHDHPRSGDHAFYGMFMAAGPAIATGKLTSASLQDITPTVLHLMGLPVSTDMDGAVLSEALRPEWLKDHEVRVIEEKPWQECAETEETDEEKLKERLRDLGYL